MDDGIADGPEDGLLDGLDVGLEDGLDVGLEDGLEDGLNDGLDDGIEDGIDEGLNDGLDDGIGVGAFASTASATPVATIPRPTIVVAMANASITRRRLYQGDWNIAWLPRGAAVSISDTKEEVSVSSYHCMMLIQQISDCGGPFRGAARDQFQGRWLEWIAVKKYKLYSVRYKLILNSNLAITKLPQSISQSTFLGSC